MSDSATPAEIHPDLEVAGFGERLLAIIDEGRRTSTYKLALLIALTDYCAEAGVTSNKAISVGTRVVADHVARLYWPQVRPFATPSGVVDLRQITNKSAAILSALADLRHQTPKSSTWEAARSSRPELCSKALDQIELTVARYPILRLQVIDGVSQPFIYDVEWAESVGLTHLHSLGDQAIHFRPGAAQQLVRLTPLIRPLVETHWMRMVAELNHITAIEDDLRRHLFGAERTAFPALLRSGLEELQSGDCFYCRKSVQADKSAIDHFIPWARWPNDAVENLVLAHPQCNGHKSNRIPGPAPLRKWSQRLNTQRIEMRRLAVNSKWSSSADRTLSLALSLYANLPSGTPLWNQPGDIVTASTSKMLGILRGAATQSD
jgi:5-methylcytosine-specific restriction endonuclease McrA